jgi:cell division transport system permease protein
MIVHALTEGFKNLTRSFWLSATAVAVLTISLGTVGGVVIGSTALGFAVRQLNNQLAISAYISRDVDTQTRDMAIEELKNIENARSVRYVSKEEAQKELIDQNPFLEAASQTLQNEDQSLVLDYIEIIPNDIDSYDSINTTLNSNRYKDIWDSIQGTEEFKKNLENIYFYMNIAVVVVIAVFGLASVLVMINILRMTVYTHRDEIEIMRLVGATNGYIQSPFIAEGIYFNLLASGFVIGGFVPLINITLPYLERFFQLTADGSINNLIIQMYISLALTIVIGCIIGIVTSYLAIQRYLKL